MKYVSGQKILIGDKVRLGDDDGLVVCDIGAGKFSTSFSKNDWAYLNKGIVIEFVRLGIVHLIEPEIDLVLIERSIL